MNECMNAWMHECMNAWMNECINAWINQSIYWYPANHRRQTDDKRLERLILQSLSIINQIALVETKHSSLILLKKKVKNETIQDEHSISFNLTVQHPQFNEDLWVTPPGLYKQRETWEFSCDLWSYRDQQKEKQSWMQFTANRKRCHCSVDTKITANMRVLHAQLIWMLWFVCMLINYL